MSKKKAQNTKGQNTGRWKIESFYRKHPKYGRVPKITYTIDSEEALLEVEDILDTDEPIAFYWAPRLWLRWVYQFDQKTGLHYLGGRLVTPEELPRLFRNYPKRVINGEAMHIIPKLHEFITNLAKENAHTLFMPEA